MNRKEVRDALLSMAEESYREFNEGLLPGTPPTAGVRVPKVRELARRAAREGAREYLQEMKGAAGESLFQEERMVQGMVIGYGKLTAEERREYLEDFVPEICSWAVCDCCTSTMKFMAADRKAWWETAVRWINSDREYEKRFGIIALMDHYLTEEYIEPVLEQYRRIVSEDYYVRMGLAWAVSAAFVKFPEPVRRLLEEGSLDCWTQNKAIQKIRESYRVSPEQKEELLSLKRKS